MRRFIIIVSLVAASAVAFAGAKAEFTDNSKTITHDCGKQPEAVVMGNENTITFTGKCVKVYVPGNENTVTVDSVEILLVQGNRNKIAANATDKISTPGNENTVTWKKGVAAAKPSVSDVGNKNKISQAK
jgi:DUF3060 family protein